MNVQAVKIVNEDGEQLLPATRSEMVYVGSANKKLSELITYDSTFKLAAHTVTGMLTTQNILPDANGTRNIGSSSYKYANVYANTFNGTATKATYAQGDNQEIESVPINDWLDACINAFEDCVQRVTLNGGSAISPVSNVLNIPAAGASATGVVTSTTQTFGGDKNFNGNVSASGGMSAMGMASLVNNVVNYNEVENKPQINGVTLAGNKTSSDLGVVATSDTRLADSGWLSTTSGNVTVRQIGKIIYFNGFISGDETFTLPSGISRPSSTQIIYTIAINPSTLAIVSTASLTLTTNGGISISGTNEGMIVMSNIYFLV